MRKINKPIVEIKCSHKKYSMQKKVEDKKLVRKIENIAKLAREI
jgi:hypothetical protein